jgi:hypothetical protein
MLISGMRLVLICCSDSGGSCVNCVESRYSNTINAAICPQCPEGRYSDQPAATVCKARLVTPILRFDLHFSSPGL